MKARLRKLSSQAQKSSEIDERQILVFIEQLFEVEESKRPEIVEILVQSTKIGSDLFSSVVIDLLCEQSLSEEYSSSCLPICAELASHRSDLSERFKSLAFEAIERNLDLELAAGLLVSFKNKIHFPLDTKVIEKFISYQKHCRYFTWNEAPPSYPNIDELLLCSYDAVSESITQPLGLFLTQDEKHIRINTCGVIKSLQKRRPQIGLDLLPELVTSLDLYEDGYGESADAKAMSRIVWAFRYSPEDVDRYLLSELSKKRPAIQELYIGIYGGLIRDRNRRWRDKDERVDEINISSEEQRGIDRCLEFIKDESLELNVRYKAVEDLNSMCFGCPHIMITYFDSLLGYYAIICEQKKTPPRPLKIFLPGQEYQEEPTLKRLNEENRQQKWEMFKDRFVDSLKELVKRDPVTTGKSVINCYNNINTKNHKHLKSALVDLLGEIGKNYLMKPQVLPVVTKALTDFESSLIRYKGIRAIEEMYRYGKSEPPKNVIDLLVLYLKDRFVIVHKAAIRVLSWNYSWLNRGQSIEALDIIVGWMYTYKDQPYDLEDVIEAMINISTRWNDFKVHVFIHIDKVFPTYQELVDQRIVENMLQATNPEEPLSTFVARKIAWCLGYYTWDHCNSYEGSRRSEMFQWLHKIPYSVYLEAKPDLRKSAKELATKDAWESCHFASLFGQFGDYAAEQEILEIASNSISGEKRYEQVKERLDLLNTVATTNTHLQNGDFELATEAISEIKEL